MKKKSWSGKLKVRYRIAGLITVIVLLMIPLARLFTGDNSFVIVPSLFFIILLNIIARRLYLREERRFIPQQIKQENSWKKKRTVWL
jgi:hypothetical protein